MANKRTTYKYRTKYGMYNVWLEKKKYSNGRVALLLMDEEGQVACTINLPEHDLQEGEVFIKTWSGNETMLDFLIKNHIVLETGRVVPMGFMKARVCTLLV